MREVIKLKHVARIRPSSVDKKTADGERSVRLCNYTDVYYNDVIRGDLEFMPASATPDQVRQFELRAGDVLITKDSETADDIAIPALIEEDLPMVLCGYHLSLIRPQQAGMDPKFLFWCMTSAMVRRQAENYAAGITRVGIRSDLVGSLLVPHQPLERQRAIASYLDAETSRVDALIAKKRRMIELLQERWRVLVELRMRELAEAHGSIPLKRVVKCLDGRRVPVSAVDRADRKGPFPYYGASGVVDWIDDYLFDEELVLLGEDGAQLGDPTCPIARVVSGKVWVNNHAHVLRPMAADPQFLALHLNTFDRMDVISGGTREKITQGAMDRIPVPHVPPDHQREIAEGLGHGRSRDSSLIERLTRQIDLLAEHRQALITAAVTGEIDIPGAAA